RRRRRGPLRGLDLERPSHRLEPGRPARPLIDLDLSGERRALRDRPPARCPQPAGPGRLHRGVPGAVPGALGAGHRLAPAKGPRPFLGVTATRPPPRPAPRTDVRGATAVRTV